MYSKLQNDSWNGMTEAFEVKSGTRQGSMLDASSGCVVSALDSLKEPAFSGSLERAWSAWNIDR